MAVTMYEECEGFRSRCSVYLDLFHRCSSVKGRAREYYMNGTVRSCTPYWNDFWFCIKMKYASETRAHVRPPHC